MTYERWERVREECHNAKMVAFGGLSKEAQAAMSEARMEGNVELLSTDGNWLIALTSNVFHHGIAYRISPSWPGPAKPEPVVKFEDLPVVCDFGHHGVRDKEPFRAISVMNGVPGFAGYVMPDGRIRPRLIFDQQKDGTYRLRVPKAVRMVKEVAK